jgi:uncharacterized protein YecT (DUF1311 family)
VDRGRIVIWKLSCVLVFVLSTMFISALADPITDADCTKPQHAQRIINHCSSVKFKATDERLTALYEKTLAAMNADERSYLKTSQDAWSRYRAAQCALEAPPSRRGSMWSAVYTTCTRLLTEARIVQLETYLYCDLRTDDAMCAETLATKPESRTE